MKYCSSRLQFAKTMSFGVILNLFCWTQLTLFCASLLEIISNSDLRLGLEFDCKQEAMLV